MTFPSINMRVAALISIAGLWAGSMLITGCERGDETVPQKPASTTSASRSNSATRENGPDAGTTTASTQDVQADLRNAAVAMESYFTDHGTYTTASLADLAAAGYRQHPGVILNVSMATPTSYCLDATARGSSEMWSFDSTEGEVAIGSCGG